MVYRWDYQVSKRWKLSTTITKVLFIAVAHTQRSFTVVMWLITEIWFTIGIIFQELQHKKFTSESDVCTILSVWCKAFCGGLSSLSYVGCWKGHVVCIFSFRISIKAYIPWLINKPRFIALHIGHSILLHKVSTWKKYQSLSAIARRCFKENVTPKSPDW